MFRGRRKGAVISGVAARLPGSRNFSQFRDKLLGGVRLRTEAEVLGMKRNVAMHVLGELILDALLDGGELILYVCIDKISNTKTQ
jgi:hypothetical protein